MLVLVLTVKIYAYALGREYIVCLVKQIPFVGRGNYLVALLLKSLDYLPYAVARYAKHIRKLLPRQSFASVGFK